MASANLLLPAARCPPNQAGGVSVTVPAWPGANLGTSRPMPRTAVLGGAWRPNWLIMMWWSTCLPFRYSIFAPPPHSGVCPPLLPQPAPLPPRLTGLSRQGHQHTSQGVGICGRRGPRGEGGVCGCGLGRGVWTSRIRVFGRLAGHPRPPPFLAHCELVACRTVQLSRRDERKRDDKEGRVDTPLIPRRNLEPPSWGPSGFQTTCKWGTASDRQPLNG